jgi:hypothetical protein
MADKAHVSSTEAIADFRAALLVYGAKMRPLLDDASDSVSRTREWLRVDRRVHWENRMKQSAAALTEAQQAVFSAELARLRPPSAAELAAVQRHRRDMSEAEEKLRILKKILLSYDKETMTRLKQVDQLRFMVTVELPKAARHLEALLASLDAYAETSRPKPEPGPAQAKPEESA